MEHYFRQTDGKRALTQKQVKGDGLKEARPTRPEVNEDVRDDPLFEPLQALAIEESAIRRVLKKHSRKGIQQWLRVADAALHEKPRGFPGFKTSPAAFLIDGIQNKRLPPDWFHAHEKERERRVWEEARAERAEKEDSLRQTYQQDRQAALQQYLKTTEGGELFNRYFKSFLAFYRTVEPDRFEKAAQEAATGKIEREKFQFPDFGVWVLEHRQVKSG
ncbi:MAG: hypothetical protein U0798_04490 [Gemmataceae bacterium]